jgi:antitoxin component HigA of HigAB toxin-antitoxin module
MNAIKLKFAEMPTDYAGLVAMYPPRPLHDAVDARNVEEIVMEMAGHPLSLDQDDYHDLLSDLLIRWQESNEPSRSRKRSQPLSAHARLKYLIEQSGTTPSQLAQLLSCSQPLVSLLLSGKRTLSKVNAKKLAAHFKLDAGYFL